MPENSPFATHVTASARLASLDAGVECYFDSMRPRSGMESQQIPASFGCFITVETLICNFEEL